MGPGFMAALHLYGPAVAYQYSLARTLGRWTVRNYHSCVIRVLTCLSLDLTMPSTYRADNAVHACMSAVRTRNFISGYGVSVQDGGVWSNTHPPVGSPISPRHTFRTKPLPVP